MASVESIPAYMLPGVPVVQPAHLEGDPSLATEVLPGPPSLQSVQQAGIPRKDHRKTVTIFSYLPASDPGTTYSGHMVSPMASTTEVGGPRRKRARLDKGSATSRAARASARNLGANASASDPPGPLDPAASSSLLLSDSDPLSMALDSDDPALSRSNSLPVGEDPIPSSNVRNEAHRRDKGKGRERDAVVRVKEEPSVVALGDAVPTNEDHCSACRSLGSLVYCDGCPRAFHLWCLNPPMEAADLPEGEARWFCPACSLQRRPPPKPASSLKFMMPLIEQLQYTLPAEFQLPQDIRTYFKDVATGPRGTYVDSSEIKAPRLNRHGQLEERDPYRLKDRNGEPVLCFRCGTSALPPGLAASAPATKRARRETSNGSHTESGRSIISCDYCHLHWHLDCVDPPLSYMPPWGKKWMCPNHADRILYPKRRIPKANAIPIDITKPHQPNNGNIEVIHPETPAPPPNKIAVDEVLINGRRYRVPERIITLDFWDKISGNHSQTHDHGEDDSAMSSPLTSLSSLVGDDDVESLDRSAPLFSLEDIEAAQLLARLQLRKGSQSPAASSELTGDNAPLEGDLGPKGGLEIKLASDSAVLSSQPGSNGVVKPVAKHSALIEEPAPSVRHVGLATSTARRTSATPRLHNGTRSRVSKRFVRTDDDEYKPASVQSVRVTSPRSSRSEIRKDGNGKDSSDNGAMSLESPPLENGSTLDGRQGGQYDRSDSASLSARPRRLRQPAKRGLSPLPLTGVMPYPKKGTGSVQEPSKDDSEEPETPLSILKPRTTSTGTGRRRNAGHKDANTPSPNKVGPTTPPPATSKASMTAAAPGPSASKAGGAESTPTLKIRLPRLGAIHLPPATISAPSTSTSNHTTIVPSIARRGRPRKDFQTKKIISVRRSSRRQTSTSASVHEASASSEA